MHAPSPREVFAKRKIRCTAQREAVYAALCATHTHPTAEELFHAVKRSYADVSLATVYNALEAFTKAGIARRLGSANAVVGGGQGGGFRYDAELHNHAHVVTADGRVIDLPDDLSNEIMTHLPPSVLERVEQRLGVKLGRISVEFIESPVGGAEAAGEED